MDEVSTEEKPIDLIQKGFYLNFNREFTTLFTELWSHLSNVSFQNLSRRSWWWYPICLICNLTLIHQENLVICSLSYVVMIFCSVLFKSCSLVCFALVLCRVDKLSYHVANLATKRSKVTKFLIGFFLINQC